jgi:hypothetical protein
MTMNCDDCAIAWCRNVLFQGGRGEGYGNPKSAFGLASIEQVVDFETFDDSSLQLGFHSGSRRL